MGRVTSLGTGRGIEGVTIRIAGGASVGMSAVSDTGGRYRIDGLSPGVASVTTTATLFEDQAQTVTLAGSTTLDLRLRRGACGGTDVSCSTQPTTCNETMPMFQPPFSGDFVVSNLMDHDIPLQFADRNGAFSSYCGGPNGRGGIDGHSGYDWLLPVGTPVLAVAAGTVRFAGTDPVFYCPTLGRDVADQAVVLVEHTSPAGEAITSVYVHLSQIDVRPGQAVGSGDGIGLSGNTGCSTQPHLHFEVRRAGFSGTAVTDPYGWQGGGADPWAREPRGAPSVWLWIDAPAILR